MKDLFQLKLKYKKNYVVWKSQS